MPEMEGIERAVLSSAGWKALSTHVIAPWALRVAPLPDAVDVLEVGSGGGGNVEAFARQFPQWRITASDFDPEPGPTRGRDCGSTAHSWPRSEPRRRSWPGLIWRRYRLRHEARSHRV